MEIQQWLLLLKQQIAETDALQWMAVGFGVAEVLLAKAGKIALYPAGLISSLLSCYILQQAGLYAEALLNLYYVIMSLYGWWYWMKKKHKPPVPISYSSRHDWLVVTLIVVAGSVVLYGLLARFTPSTVPFWDSFISATAWAGMWLLARRKIENWILLNISNLFAIPLLFYKQLPLYALLTIFLFCVAIAGYFSWRRTYQQYKPIFQA